MDDVIQQSSTGVGRDRPILAIICNGPAPYRTHLHRRIVREVPELQLCSVFTHDAKGGTWGSSLPTDITPVHFGTGETNESQDRPGRALHEWHKGGQIIQWMKKTGVRVVVLLGYNDAGRLRVLWWCRRNQVPVFVWGDSNIRGDLARGLRALAKRFLLGWVIRQADGMLPCGQLGEAFFKKYGASSGRMFRFPVEPDYSLIEDLRQQQVEAARVRYGLQPDRNYLIYSGRFAPEKRVDLLLDAFTSIARRRPQWDLLLIGDGPLRRPLLDRVPEGLRSRIISTGFIDEQSTICALYGASDVLVLPSDYEPWALVVNEAAAAGLAIICSDVVGAAAELVCDGRNGRLFPHGDAAGLAACLLDVTDPAHLPQMKAASAEVLAAWRRGSDPVAGLRAALRFVGVLPG